LFVAFGMSMQTMIPTFQQYLSQSIPRWESCQSRYKTTHLLGCDTEQSGYHFPMNTSFVHHIMLSFVCPPPGVTYTSTSCCFL
jgi:hypothetical protein